MNNISIIGTGYVGLVTGTCLSEFGMQVTCMDIDENKINALKHGEIPIYEPGLQTLVEKNYKSGRLKFTTNLKEAVDNSIAIFIAVGTPPREDGSADLHYVLSAARAIAKNMTSYKVIVDKSTVPVGTGQSIKNVIKETLAKRGLKIDFDVVSNPEFLREGAAVRDFMHPDRIVIGYESEKARSVMKNIYNVLYLIDRPFVFTSIETAELIKYASNGFLATKISFINQIANLCDAIGADVNDVSKAMGLDGRIGKYFLHPGPGYGGSCFPKDTKALENIGKKYDIDMSLVRAVNFVNENQKKYAVHKIKAKMRELNGKTICILGLAFKPETDDMREAPSITIITELIQSGAKVKAFDPAAMDNARKYIFEPELFINGKLELCFDEYETAVDADALIIVTEWNQFRNLDLYRIKEYMKDNYFFDLRNVYNRETIEEIGFNYEGMGRGKLSLDIKDESKTAKDESKTAKDESKSA